MKASPMLLRSIIRQIALLVIVAVVLYPVLWLVGASFKNGFEIFGNAAVLPQEPTVANFSTVLGGIGTVSFWRFLLNSLVIATLSVIGIVASSSVSAYAFARLSFPGRGALFSVMISTLLLPVHVVIIPQYILFQRAGLIDTFVPLTIGKFLAVEAFFVFLYVQFIRSIPRELDEAARIDGCGHAATFMRIIFPLLNPATITASIFAFIWSWNEFLGPLLYLTSPENYTLPMALRTYNDATSAGNFGAVMALAILALIPVLLFFAIFQRFLTGGVATQGLKG